MSFRNRCSLGSFTLVGAVLLCWLGCSSTVNPRAAQTAAGAGGTPPSAGGAASAGHAGAAVADGGSSGSAGDAGGTDSSSSDAGAGGAPVTPAMRALDTLIFGDAPSESAHQLAAPDTETFMGALSQSARRSLPSSPPSIYGGSLTFTMKVDPTRRTYVTVKLWGEDEANGGADLGRMYLYVVNDGKDYQVGYRHEGDYVGLNVAGSKAPLAGRFFYASTLLPFAMTQGRSSLTLKVVSAGRIYPLGSGLAPAGNYQFLMSGKGRGVYRAYTHTQALLDVSEEAQGRAPASSVRSVPGVEVMQPGGAFYEGVASRKIASLPPQRWTHSARPMWSTWLRRTALLGYPGFRTRPSSTR